MGTKVAVESDPRLAGPGTVRVWEETVIARSFSRRLSSYPSLLDLCAAPLLKCVHGVSGEGSPSSHVMSAGLKLRVGNLYMAYAGFHVVFESLERPALLSLLRSELPKHQLQNQTCQIRQLFLLAVICLVYNLNFVHKICSKSFYRFLLFRVLSFCFFVFCFLSCFVKLNECSTDD